MAQVTICPNGVTASIPRYGPQPNVAKRGKVNGWSDQAVARFQRKLYSIDGNALTGVPFVFSLTLRNCPESAQALQEVISAWIKRLRRAGMLRLQWLIEWQGRGVPHLHGILYLADGCDGIALATRHWLELTGKRWGAGKRGQHVVKMHQLTGWLMYQAKHSARGVQHYQRVGVPKSWTDGTGRLWGFVGDWPMREEKLDVSREVFWRFRRLVAGWLVADARKQWQAASGPWPAHWDIHKAMKREAAAWKRLVYLSGMLRCPDLKFSRVRPIGEFVPEQVAYRLLAAAYRHEHHTG